MQKSDGKNRLGDYVREQRQARGLSGGALAAAAGVDRAWLHRLEHGQFDSPDPYYFVRLARALEVDVADLYLAAGLPTGHGLPGVRPYLRAKFDLPDEAIRRIEEYVTAVADEYETKEDGDDERAAPAA